MQIRFAAFKTILSKYVLHPLFIKKDQDLYCIIDTTLLFLVWKNIGSLLSYIVFFIYSADADANANAIANEVSLMGY